MNYITVIGLEIHAELQTKTKLFCACENAFGGEKSTRVCPVCLGRPGSLPSLNREAVILSAKAGFSLNSKVHHEFSFDRKNYFYPDLPKAYQISQLYRPVCTGGNIDKFRINNIHIEEDAGKLIHSSFDSEIDLNRCGVPLIEIVTEPDFKNADEVSDFLSELSRRFKYADICDCKMEQGSLRVDVNISLMKETDKTLGVRAEIKNLNSFRSIRRAIEFEEKRQREILERGGKVLRETRRFDEKTGETFPMRSKEDSTDYRYFPEPDIPTVFISEKELEKIRKSLPEMPRERFLRYTKEFNLKEEHALLLIEDRGFSDFFDSAVALYNNPIETAKLMLGELNRILNLKKSSEIPFSAEYFSDLIRLFCENKINNNEQKEILKIMFETQKSPHIILEEIKKDVSEDDILNKIHSLMKEHENLENPKYIDFFLGQIIRTFGKSVDPKACRELIIKEIKQNHQ